MKRWLSVLFISASLCGVHLGQDNSGRIIQGIHGLVKSVRVEVATLISNGDALVEATRITTNTMEVNESGTMAVDKHYRRDGVVDRRQVTLYDANGNATESLLYDEEDRLVTRMIQHHEVDAKRLETFNYDKDGSLRTSGVTHLDNARALMKGETREKDGNLVQTQLAGTEKPGQRREEHTWYKHGQLTEKRVKVVLSTTQYEVRYYDASGALKLRHVITHDSTPQLVETATYDGQDKLITKESFERVYDSRGNWTKEIRSRWNLKAARFQAFDVTYRTITYYE